MSSNIKRYTEIFIKLMRDMAGYDIEKVRLAPGDEEGLVSDIWSGATTASFVNITFKCGWNPKTLRLPERVTVSFMTDTDDIDEVIADWTCQIGQIDIVDLVQRLATKYFYLSYIIENNDKELHHAR